MVTNRLYCKPLMIRCEWCGCPCPTMEKAKAQIKRWQELEGAQECKICHQKYMNYRGLANHITRCEGLTMFAYAHRFGIDAMDGDKP
jgi:hypothetical protein